MAGNPSDAPTASRSTTSCPACPSPLATSTGPSGKPETVLQTILDSGKVELVEPSWDIHKKDIRLHVRNPTIVWPGRGGYWNEVDINDVEVVDA